WASPAKGIPGSGRCAAGFPARTQPLRRSRISWRRRCGWRRFSRRCTGSPPGAHNFGRGAPLATRDAATRQAIARLGDELDLDTVTAAWERAVRAPGWDGPPRWIHGDPYPA